MHSAVILCRDIVDIIAIRCGLNGPRIENRWERDFPCPSRPTPIPTQPPVQFVQIRPCCDADQPSPFSAAIANGLELYTSDSPLCLHRQFMEPLSHLLSYLTPYPSNSKTIEPSVLLCYLFMCTHFYSREQL